MDADSRPQAAQSFKVLLGCVVLDTPEDGLAKPHLPEGSPNFQFVTDNHDVVATPAAIQFQDRRQAEFANQIRRSETLAMLSVLGTSTSGNWLISPSVARLASTPLAPPRPSDVSIRVEVLPSPSARRAHKWLAILSSHGTMMSGLRSAIASRKLSSGAFGRYSKVRLELSNGERVLGICYCADFEANLAECAAKAHGVRPKYGGRHKDIRH